MAGLLATSDVTVVAGRSAQGSKVTPSQMVPSLGKAILTCTREAATGGVLCPNFARFVVPPLPPRLAAAFPSRSANPNVRLTPHLFSPFFFGFICRRRTYVTMAVLSSLTLSCPLVSQMGKEKKKTWKKKQNFPKSLEAKRLVSCTTVFPSATVWFRLQCDGHPMVSYR